MVLSVLSILRERLPCSENYWRYRRNFELSMSNQASDQRIIAGNDKVESVDSKQKFMAGSQMSFVKNLS
jgi:hypothetical protein